MVASFSQKLGMIVVRKARMEPLNFFILLFDERLARVNNASLKQFLMFFRSVNASFRGDDMMLGRGQRGCNKSISGIGRID